MAIQIEGSVTGLADILGIERVSTARAVRAAYTVDGLTPESVVYPRTESDVAAILQFASDHGLGVIPCRNATKLHIGNVPRRYDVALCLKEMNQVWHYEPADLTVSAEPGMKLGDFQHLLSRHGLWIPLDPPGGAKASLGGIVATNAAGPLRTKYGAPRDMVLGMKVATTQGAVIKSGGHVVKNVAGYDLSKLMIGSYGTLGVIVEISLKLFPLPAERATWVLEIPNFEAARAFRRRLMDSPLSPMRAVLLDGGAASWAHGKSPRDPAPNLEIWIEAGGSKGVIERSESTLRSLAESSGMTGIPQSRMEGFPAEDGWNRISDFSTSLAAAFPQLVDLKATLPIASNEDFVEMAQSKAAERHFRLACFSQNAVGVVHVCLLADDLDPSLGEIIQAMRQEAIRRGGALVIERCAIELKASMDVWGPPGDDFGIMRKVKDVWDPKGILSPGRFVGGL